MGFTLLAIRCLGFFKFFIKKYFFVRINGSYKPWKLQDLVWFFIGSVWKFQEFFYFSQDPFHGDQDPWISESYTLGGGSSNTANLTGYGQTALRKRPRMQQDKDSMVLKWRRIKPSLLMPRKAREKEGIFTTISTKLEDQVLLSIGGRRIYHTYNVISVRNMVTMQASV